MVKTRSLLDAWMDLDKHHSLKLTFWELFVVEEQLIARDWNNPS